MELRQKIQTHEQSHLRKKLLAFHVCTLLQIVTDLPKAEYIDEVNSALSHKLERHEKNYELQNLLNLIDIEVTNKKLKTTLFNELESKQNKIEQLEKELKIKEESILSLKKSHEDFKKMNKQQQELISQAFHYFLKKSSQENLIFFDSALTNIFSNPLDYLSLFREEKTQNQNNIADFFKNRLKNN
ncbi:hypothetical protein MHZ95_08925 [Sporosarcina sp. ACRSM]|uniref:hypothetical protein n=1 Tax=Sporosarcina sp. ACRSM TaxID=2918216 RepID=UPI001EF73A56|nr:hypothetical protein [Sporosarcina sp. ACRSM]MCG7335400.1 hypothetical protein [Sporosarcina sp. ACRSM]